MSQNSLVVANRNLEAKALDPGRSRSTPLRCSDFFLRVSIQPCCPVLLISVASVLLPTKGETISVSRGAETELQKAEMMRRASKQLSGLGRTRGGHGVLREP